MGNRVLTIDEICNHIGPIWFQQRYCRFSECVVYMYEHMPFFKFKIVSPYNRHWHIKAVPALYGKSWRCWEKKPSAEDLAMKFGGTAEEIMDTMESQEGA